MQQAEGSVTTRVTEGVTAEMTGAVAGGWGRLFAEVTSGVLKL